MKALSAPCTYLGSLGPSVSAGAQLGGWVAVGSARARCRQHLEQSPPLPELRLAWPQNQIPNGRSTTVRHKQLTLSAPCYALEKQSVSLGTAVLAVLAVSSVLAPGWVGHSLAPTCGSLF